jgi:hypothetical protein
MNRRSFLRKSGIAATLGLTALAGCTGTGSDSAPPRKSEVFQEINVKDNGALVVDLEDTVEVQSRVDISNTGGSNSNSQSLGDQAQDVASDLNPVGVAAAAKGRGGRGRAGGARGARKAGAKGRNGRAKLYGGTGNTYVFWWNDHKDDVEEHNAKVEKIGITRLGDADKSGKGLPGPGKPEGGWDRTVDNPSQNFKFTPGEPGWYRVAAHLMSPNGDHDFGWEAVDLQIVKNDNDNLEAKQSWKVSPRL